MGILRWDKPPRVMSVEEWKRFEADSAPPGTYQPNMSDDDARTWRAEIKGKTTDHCVVEIRKSLGSLLVVKVARDGVIRDKYGNRCTGDLCISMNGPCYLSFAEWGELMQCIDEALSVLASLEI